MSTASAYSAIKSYLDANWTTTPLVYENTDTAVANSPTAYVYVEISGETYLQSSIGAGTVSGNLWREEGMLWLHVMIPTGGGSLNARTYAENMVNMLRGAELLSGRLVFKNSSVGLGEAGIENGNYWMLTASVEWQLNS